MLPPGRLDFQPNPINNPACRNFIPTDGVGRGFQGDPKYYYRFSSPEEAKRSIDDAEAFSVSYKGGRADRIDNTMANRQNLKVVPDGFKYEEL